MKIILIFFRPCRFESHLGHKKTDQKAERTLRSVFFVSSLSSDLFHQQFTDILPSVVRPGYGLQCRDVSFTFIDEEFDQNCWTFAAFVKDDLKVAGHWNQSGGISNATGSVVLEN